MSQIIYEALYNPCIHESGAIAISLHRTLKGAKKAVRTHKAGEKKYWKDWGNNMLQDPDAENSFGYKDFQDFQTRHPFGQHQWWGTKETELLD